MKALRIESFGTPSEVLKYVDIEDAPLGANEVRVRIEASGINPSDIGNISGKFPKTTLPASLAATLPARWSKGLPT